MTSPRILIAGIGNVFYGDDGFGVAVVQELAAELPLPGVRVMDVGIRGIDLTYALLEGWDATILVDATPRGRDPGTLYVLELPPAEVPPTDLPLDAHGLSPERVLAVARSMGASMGRVRLVGCEPARLTADDDEMMLGLSVPVQAAVHPAASLVLRLVHDLRGGPDA